MTALTSRMQTVCFGRYLANIPIGADFSIGGAYSESVKFELTPSYADEQAYRDHLKEHEQRLRTSKHVTEGTLLRSTALSSDGKQVIFMSRTDMRDRRTTLVESFVMRPPYRLSYVAADEDVREITDEISKLTQRLASRDATPSRPSGACIADGLLDFTPTYNESFFASAGMDSPAWIINFSTNTDGPTDPGKDLHSRVDQAIEMIGPEGAKIRKLRRGFVTVDGRKGREYLGIYPADRNGPTESFDAKLEVEGSGKAQQPNIKLHMETVWPRKRDPSDPTKYLSQDDALALWDAVVKSVRLRPGAF